MRWYERDRIRLLLEKEAMNDRFSDFELIMIEDKLCWTGILQTNRYNDYGIRLMYGDKFPVEVPKVFPIAPEIKKNDHLYPDGSMCLYFPLDRIFSPETTAATVLGIATAWLFCYEDWLETGRWPGKKVEHELPE